jgi:hypothetical protein
MSVFIAALFVVCKFAGIGYAVNAKWAVAQITIEKMLPVSCDSHKPSGESFFTAPYSTYRPDQVTIGLLKKIPLTAPQNFIANLFGQQSVEK